MSLRSISSGWSFEVPDSFDQVPKGKHNLVMIYLVCFNFQFCISVLTLNVNLSLFYLQANPEVAKDMMICVYNQTHHIKASDMSMHLLVCRDAQYQQMYGLASSKLFNFIMVIIIILI